MFDDNRLLDLADQLAKRPRSWFEDKLVSAEFYSYAELKGPGSDFASILVKREFVKAVLFDLRMTGRLDRFLTYMELDDELPGEQERDSREVPSEDTATAEPTAEAGKKSWIAALRLPRISVATGIAILGLLVTILIFLYGNNQCNQSNPPTWITPLLEAFCPKGPAPPDGSVTPTLVPATRETQDSSAPESSGEVADLVDSDACEALEIEISEVMFSPQAPSGDAELNELNEYVELRNLGNEAVEAGGLWIADSGGHPGKIVSWSEVFGEIPMGEAVTSTTLIPPDGYAVILPQLHEQGDLPYSDDLPAETIVLTLEGKDVIGNGLVATEGSVLDVVVLYRGTDHLIDCVVSTYGTPTVPLEGSDPTAIKDDGLDGLPRAIAIGTGWGGFYRRFAAGADSYSNWARFYWSERSPGSQSASGSPLVRSDVDLLGTWTKTEKSESHYLHFVSDGPVAYYSSRQNLVDSEPENRVQFDYSSEGTALRVSVLDVSAPGCSDGEIGEYIISGGADRIDIQIESDPCEGRGEALQGTWFREVLDGCAELISEPWLLEGTEAQEAHSEAFDPNLISQAATIEITYDLNGLDALGGDASAVILIQSGEWYLISLSDYGANGYDGPQSVRIPIADFGLSHKLPVGALHSRFWYEGRYQVEILSIRACHSS